MTSTVTAEASVTDVNITWTASTNLWYIRLIFMLVSASSHVVQKGEPLIVQSIVTDLVKRS